MPRRVSLVRRQGKRLGGSRSQLRNIIEVEGFKAEHLRSGNPFTLTSIRESPAPLRPVPLPRVAGLGQWLQTLFSFIRDHILNIGLGGDFPQVHWAPAFLRAANARRLGKRN